MNRRLRNGDIVFVKKNIVSCRGVSISKIVWEYVCWALAGKPERNKK